jgi:hypothetical protein
MRPRPVAIASIALLLLGVYAYSQRAALSAWAFSLTGEEQPASQVRGLWHLALQSLTRPPLDLQPEVPIQHNGVNPFGMNTFLQHFVEPEKRERQLRLISEAGFHWIRQEFPWADIEISGQGNFDDCRNEPCRSAWDKYDNIVELAEKHGLTIIVRLSSPPDWSRADGSARGAFAPPDNFSDFADYAQTVAERYKDRLRYYQVWNEPNIYPEWGDQPADPVAYTRLLCETYRRLKAVDPGIVVVSGVLAPTQELGGVNPATAQAAELNDFVFLQRMYDAGAGGCFDVMAVQGYGLWSGPTDRRMRPIVMNYARNQFIRDIMVKNGDAHKALWIAEMNWNTVPETGGIAPNFGRVTEEQQARYVPLAYQRAQAEWPWVGVVQYWFFMRASDAEKDQAWYYFRMAEPDFTLQPVYEAMKAYTRQPPVMHPGWFQEDHWAVQWDEGWRVVTDPIFTFGVARASHAPGAAARFTFNGTELWLVTARGPAGGQMSVRIDDGPPQPFDLSDPIPESQVRLRVARGLTDGAHTVEIVNHAGADRDTIIDGFIARRVPDRTAPLLAAFGALLLGVWMWARRIQDERLKIAARDEGR